jgi:hypothetical protein
MIRAPGGSAVSTPASGRPTAGFRARQRLVGETPTLKHSTHVADGRQCLPSELGIRRARRRAEPTQSKRLTRIGEWRVTTQPAENDGTPSCRFCRSALRDTVVDLGMSPLCESYLRADQLNQMEPFYPLHVLVCRECWLVQLDQYVSAEHIFD